MRNQFFRAFVALWSLFFFVAMVPPAFAATTVTGLSLSSAIYNTNTWSVMLSWTAVSGAQEYFIYENGQQAYTNSTNTTTIQGYVNITTFPIDFQIVAETVDAYGNISYTPLSSSVTLAAPPSNTMGNSTWTYEGSTTSSSTGSTSTSSTATASCSSVPSPTGLASANLYQQSNGLWSVTLSWNPVPGAYEYEIYGDGNYSGTTTSTVDQYYNISKTSYYQVVAVVDNPSTGTSTDSCLSNKVTVTIPNSSLQSPSSNTVPACPSPPEWQQIAQEIGQQVWQQAPTFPVPPAGDATVSNVPSMSAPNVTQGITPSAPHFIPSTYTGPEFNKTSPNFTSGYSSISVPTSNSMPFSISDPEKLPHQSPGIVLIPGSAPHVGFTPTNPSISNSLPLPTSSLPIAGTGPSYTGSSSLMGSPPAWSTPAPISVSGPAPSAYSSPVTSPSPSAYSGGTISYTAIGTTGTAPIWGGGS